jgi:ribose transport system ATP-binding protein
MAEPFIKLDHISKAYPGALAVDQVSMSVAAGEVIGLVGENGAGKSTLMKILSGVVAPSAGQLHVDGVAHQRLTVAQAMTAGIAFVHQEPNLFDNLDVAANVLIGREPCHGGWLRLVDNHQQAKQVKPLLDLLGVDFQPNTPVASLSIAQRQLVEIARALSLRSRLLVLDEPTSSLTLTETRRLLQVIQSLRADGVSVIFVSHRLHELAEVADRVIGLRDGKLAGELVKDEINREAMIHLMIGRDLKALYTPPATPPGDALLQITGATTTAYPAQAVDLTLRCGEILGLAGLVGAGRSELARAIFGIDPLLQGSVHLAGQHIRVDTPQAAIAQGIFLVPEDRKRSGLLLDVSIADNIALPNLRRYARTGLVQAAAIRIEAERQAAQLNIRAPNVAATTDSLSGGNQQKTVLAKWLAMNPRVLICDEPTRGIDVGAKQDIYLLLRQLADSGMAILLISSDMEEVLGVSDRIAVMHEGRISGTLERGQFSEQNVLRLAVGDHLH